MLLKGVSAEGFLFFTNYDSRKGKELAAPPMTIVVEPREDRGRGGPVRVGQLGDLRAHALDQDVQIAHLAEQSTQPAELRAEPFDRREIRFEGLEVRTQSTGRDARVVDGVGVGDRSDLRILADQPDHAPRQRVSDECVQVRPGTEPRDSDLGLRLASERRLQLRGRRWLRSRPDQPIGKLPEEPPGPRALHLELDLAERRTGDPVDR